jgi:hypothetical protein
VYGTALAVNPGDMSDLAYGRPPLAGQGSLTVSRSGDVPAVPSPRLDSLGRHSRSQRPAEALAKAGERLRPKAVSRATSDPSHNHTFETQADAPACHECGSIMVRNGSCYRCL